MQRMILIIWLVLCLRTKHLSFCANSTCLYGFRALGFEICRENKYFSKPSRILEFLFTLQMLNCTLLRNMLNLCLFTHMGIEGRCLSMLHTSNEDNTLLTKGKGRVGKRECLHCLCQKIMCLFCLCFQLTRSLVCDMWLWSVMLNLF